MASVSDTPIPPGDAPLPRPPAFHPSSLPPPFPHMGKGPAQIQYIQARRLRLHPQARAQPMKTTAAAVRPQKLYRGVRSWVAEIRLPRNHPRLYLGTIHTAEEAAHAYDQAAYRLHEDAARLNFPFLDKAASSRAPLHAAVDAKLQAISLTIASASNNTPTPRQ